MDFSSSVIPQIEISLAPLEDPPIESPSLFTFNLQHDEDHFRPVHLTPPPSVTAFKRPLSPLRPASHLAAKGLDNDRFQVLLNASKEKTAAFSGGKKSGDLRKEIALKVHKNKQMERRALFLSKVQAPPSPSAACTPKTPPESPAIFHYSLPSPGLVSPLALFETLNDSKHETWVEQVDFRLPGMVYTKEAIHKTPKQPYRLPSLDQISARLMSRSAKTDTIEFPQLAPTNNQPRPSVGIGRLRMPLRSSKVATQLEEPSKQTVNTVPALPPKSPLLHLSPELRVTTLVVPRTQTRSHADLTESNLNALNSRGQRAHDMLSTLRRRTLSTEHKAPTPLPRPIWKRRSAPADMMPRGRKGFEHPVLALPGAF
ncbi:hypothetical protein CPC08DRAFT_739047 [Agrocybe pediades]|nr:hypothetical protein CPC08DRAFT_739047 [Agrocybe pediades]